MIGGESEIVSCPADVLVHRSEYLLARQVDPELLLDLIEAEQGTHISLVPSQIIALLETPGFDVRRLASLECIMSVGAPLLRSYKDRLKRAIAWKIVRYQYQSSS